MGVGGVDGGVVRGGIRAGRGQIDGGLEERGGVDGGVMEGG